VQNEKSLAPACLRLERKVAPTLAHAMCMCVCVCVCMYVCMYVPNMVPCSGNCSIMHAHVVHASSLPPLTVDCF
jgi:hypothetical protein